MAPPQRILFFRDHFVFIHYKVAPYNNDLFLEIALPWNTDSDPPDFSCTGSPLFCKAITVHDTCIDPRISSEI